MVKTKNIVSAAMAVLMSVTSVVNLLPITAFAQEQDASAANEVPYELQQLEETAKAGTMDVVYVQSLTVDGGNGTEEYPMHDFKDAYKMVREGGRIVLLDAVPVQNDDQNSDKGIFTLSKSVTIEGQKSGAFCPRVPIQLEADITLNNVGFSAKKVYLNGYSMIMDGVTQYAPSPVRTVFFGGSYQNQSENAGKTSSLTVTGQVSNPFEIKAIYAGSETGESGVKSDFHLESGAYVLEGVHAGGMAGKTTGTVRVYAGDVNISAFLNEFAVEDTSLTLNNFHPVGAQRIEGFHNVTLQNSNVPIKDGGSLSDVRALKLLDGSTLDLSQTVKNLTVDQFTGSEDSVLVLAQDGKLTVQEAFEGGIDLRTPGADTATSGMVLENHAYLSASNTSTGTVVFRPYVTQTNLELQTEESGDRRNWVTKKKQLNEIDSIQIEEPRKVEISDETEAVFSVEYVMKGGKELNYIPQLEVSFVGSDGQPMDDSIYAYFDMVDGAVHNPAQLVVQVFDPTLQPGTYTMQATDQFTDRTYSIDFDFYSPGVNDRYMVQFMPNGGNGSAKQQSMQIGTKTPLEKNTFTREGFSFEGWALTENGPAVYTDEALVQDLADTPDAVVMLYAVWAPRKFDVVFDSKGGTAVGQKTVAYGEPIGEPSTPTKTGYSFGGWYKDADCQTKWDFKADKMPANNITLYAKWDAASYRVSFDSKGGTAVGQKTVAYGELIGEPSTPTKTGYSFGGWYKDADCQTKWDFKADKMPANNITLYAKWDAASYRVSFDSKGGTAVGQKTVAYGEPIGEPSTPTKTGYSFGGWYKDADCQTKWDFKADKMPANNITLYAKWDAASYRVSFDSKGGTAVGQKTVAYGELIGEPSAPTKTGYSFGGWYKDADCQTKWDFKADKMPANNITLYAKWDLQEVPFKDVQQSDYYYKPVQWAVGQGITAGTADDLFSPNLRCTRAQAVTMLWRLFGSKDVEQAHGFDDVAKTDYYDKAVRWAKNRGIVSGVSDTKFGPDVVCTRAQIVMMLWRAAGSLKVEESVTFVDVAPNDYFAEAVKWAKVKGITAGIGNGRFAPDAPCTRAQMVSFLYKF